MFEGKPPPPGHELLQPGVETIEIADHPDRPGGDLLKVFSLFSLEPGAKDQDVFYIRLIQIIEKITKCP